VSQAIGLNADNRVSPRIEARIATEYRDCEAIFLYGFGTPVESFLNDELKEPAIALGRIEILRCNNTL
jgi:hypothetical protein